MGNDPHFPPIARHGQTAASYSEHVVDTTAAGFAALAAKQWAQARSLLEQAGPGAGSSTSPEVLDALADACWWLGDVDAALAARQRAVDAWRRRGEFARAVRAAVWIAIEYANSLAHDAASRGWVARAETMASDLRAGPAADGWVALGHATLDADPLAQVDAAERALKLARQNGDDELEVLGLARLGWATVATGSVDAGVGLFDEAMAVATAAGFEHPSALGELCCQLALATETTGERDRFASWLEVVRHVNSEYRYPPLAGFCATCCAELHSIDGNWDAAEAHLRYGIDRLRSTGHRARCGPPVAKLAELLILQGRVEEAADVLGDDDRDSTLVARARLALATGDADAARVLVDRYVRRIGDNLPAVTALSVAGEAALARRDRDGAEAICERIAAIASRTANRRAAGAAALLEGHLLLDADERDAAASAFERALDHYAGLNGLLDAAHTSGSQKRPATYGPRSREWRRRPRSPASNPRVHTA